MAYQFLKFHPAIAGKDLTLFGSKLTMSPTRRTLRDRHMTGHQLVDNHLLNHPTHNLSHFVRRILDQSVMRDPCLRQTPLCLIEFDFQFSASPQRRFQFLSQIDNNAIHGLPPVTRCAQPKPPSHPQLITKQHLLGIDIFNDFSALSTQLAKAGMHPQ